jgi:formylglycine-generating enzyme required for sulfatase activity
MSMFFGKSLHTAAVIVALLLALAMVGCPPPSGEGEGETDTVMLPGAVPLEMVWIHGGTFMMGRYADEQDSLDREDPRHQVTVPGFWMGKYELTKRQWQAVMGTTPWSGYDHVLDDLDSPAVWVSWDDAKAFITELNMDTGLTFRLPSEAEWEYACRADTTTTTRFYWGDDTSYTLIDDYAWWWGNAWDADEQYAHVVGLKLPNAFGLYDMSGNVLEWCEDDWHYGYTGAPTNGSAWVDSPRGSYRMIRGGRWNDYGYDCRSASRTYSYPSYTYIGFGFRLSR